MAQITIPKGATLSGLATQYNTDIKSLMSSNPSITDPNKIMAGATLTIPETMGKLPPITTTAPAGQPTPPTAAPTAAPTAPPAPPAPTGEQAMPYSFGSYMDMMTSRMKQKNEFIDQRQALIKHLYDEPLTPQEQGTLSPSMQKAISGGNKQDMEFEIRLLNDQIKGRADTLDSAVKYISEGYKTQQDVMEKKKTESVKLVDDILGKYSQSESQKIFNQYSPERKREIERLSGRPEGFLDKIPMGLTEKKVSGGGIGGGDLQEQLRGALAIYNATGTIPPLGYGQNNPLRRAFYAAVGGAPDLASEAVLRKYSLAGANKALGTQENQYYATKTAFGTLDKQLGLAQKYSDKVSRSDSPFVNKYILWTKGQIAGDAETQAFNNIVITASNEFAKILAGSAASISGVTVSSAEEARQLLNTSLSKGQFNEVLSVMKQEADFRLDSQKQTIDEIKSEISGGFKDTGTQTGDVNTDLESDITTHKGDYKTREELINALTSVYPEMSKEEISSKVYNLIPDVK